MKNHKHYWHPSSWTSQDINFSCRCGERRNRAMTEEEKKFHKIHYDFNFNEPRETNVHYVWHDFLKKFKIKRNKASLIEYGWKYTGYDLMERIEQWAKKHPDDVFVCPCDDDMFATSFLVLIDHKTKEKYFGVTICFIPQCTGEDPICLFLYPFHMEILKKTIAGVHKEARIIKRIERNANNKQSKDWRNLLMKTGVPSVRINREGDT